VASYPEAEAQGEDKVQDDDGEVGGVQRFYKVRGEKEGGGAQGIKAKE